MPILVCRRSHCTSLSSPSGKLWQPAGAPWERAAQTGTEGAILPVGKNWSDFTANCHPRP